MKKLAAILILAVACIACDPPTAATTGPPVPCDQLAPYTGPTTITTAGATVDSVSFVGNLIVAAPNVSLTNSCFSGHGNAVIQVSPGADNTAIDHVRMTRDDPTAKLSYDIYLQDGSGSANISRSDIEGAMHGINEAVGGQGHPVQIGLNYIKPALTDPGDHVDGIICNGGCYDLTIEGNSIENPNNQTSSIALFDNGYRCGPMIPLCPSHGIKVLYNVLNGGGWCLYGGFTSDNIDVEHNIFANTYYPNCGAAGLTTGFDPNNPGNIWANNTRPDGTPVNP